jgi:hypothetical protein
MRTYLKSKLRKQPFSNTYHLSLSIIVNMTHKKTKSKGTRAARQALKESASRKPKAIRNTRDTTRLLKQKHEETECYLPISAEDIAKFRNVCESDAKSWLYQQEKKLNPEELEKLPQLCLSEDLEIKTASLWREYNEQSIGNGSKIAVMSNTDDNDL